MQLLQAQETIKSGESSFDQDLNNCKQGIVQRSIAKYMTSDTSSYSRKYPQCIKHDRDLALMIVMDLKPFSECNSPGLNLLLKGMNRQYNLPTRDTLKTNVIQPMYQETKDFIKKLLVPATDIALTCDIWSTLQGSTWCYVTVTCHLINENLICMNLC